MKKFFIESSHDIFEDDWQKGEGREINFFKLSAMIDAKTKEKAIVKYYDEVLNYTYSGNYNQDSVTVDKDYIELNETELKEWREGKLAFINSFKLEIWCCEPC